jgi:hypothetical protein
VFERCTGWLVVRNGGLVGCHEIAWLVPMASHPRPAVHSAVSQARCLWMSACVCEAF